MPAILADELGAGRSKVEVENAPVAKAYENPQIHFMLTGNSESIHEGARYAIANLRLDESEPDRRQSL